MTFSNVSILPEEAQNKQAELYHGIDTVGINENDILGMAHFCDVHLFGNTNPDQPSVPSGAITLPGCNRLVWKILHA